MCIKNKKNFEFPIATYSFCIARQKKNIKKTSYLGAQTSLYLWRKITDSHRTHLDDNEQTYLYTPTLHFYPTLVENHHVLDAPARTILAFHEKHEHAHTDTKQVASRSSVSLQNEFLPPIRATIFSQGNT